MVFINVIKFIYKEKNRVKKRFSFFFCQKTQKMIDKENLKIYNSH